MSPETAGAEVVEPAAAATRPSGGWTRPRAGIVEGLVGRLLSRDVFGVRLGALVLVLPIFVATLWMQIASRGVWNHPPDSRYYLPMMSRDMGHSLGDAVAAQRHVSPGWQVAPWYFADDDPAWQLVRIRILYPFLSIPFVWLFGLSAGSLVVPILADLLFFWVVARMLQRLYGPAVAVIVTGAFALVQPIFNVTWAGTDTLAMALAAVIVANLPIGRPAAKANLAWLGIATVAVALTRQVGVLAPAMAGAGWLWALVRERSWRNRWLGSLVVTSVLTLLVQVVSMVFINVDTKGIVSHGQSTTLGVLRYLVHQMRLVTRDDIAYMWHFDRVLLALFVAAVVAVLLRFASDATAVFVGATAATYVIIGGVGFASAMRYEMVLFPAVAVAAGAVVALALSHRSEPAGERRQALEDQGPKTPRADRWVPQTTAAVVLLAIALAVSIPGGIRSSVSAPASPSFAAAQGGRSYAIPPLATPTAESTLKMAFSQLIVIVNGHGMGQSTFDWTHAVRYRPTTKDDPGWAQRSADGTTVTRLNGMIAGEDYSLLRKFGRSLTFDGTVVPASVKILSRQTSAYGEDVEFTVQDKAGRIHQGHATTLYPVWNRRDPGLITALVFTD